MTYVPRPNMENDTDEPMSPADLYTPHIIDSSIVQILRHRGVPEDRIAKVVMDLDYSVGLAYHELAALLPCSSRPRFEYGRMGEGWGYVGSFVAIITEAISWSGTQLTIQHCPTPETVLKALVGQPLSKVLEHPAIPERTILSARMNGRQLVVDVEGDLVPVLELSGASDAIKHGSAMRCMARRRLVDRSARSRDMDDWIGWLEDQPVKAAKAFLAGERPTHGSACWGEIDNPIGEVARTIGAHVVKVYSGGKEAVFPSDKRVVNPVFHYHPPSLFRRMWKGLRRLAA